MKTYTKTTKNENEAIASVMANHYGLKNIQEVVSDAYIARDLNNMIVSFESYRKTEKQPDQKPACTIKTKNNKYFIYFR